jgi:hypothetical protein
MELQQAQELAGELLRLAPGSAAQNMQRLQRRISQISTAIQDLVPAADMWILLRRGDADRVPEEGGTLLDWTLALIDRDAFYRMIPWEGAEGGLRIQFIRIPHSATRQMSVTDVWSAEGGATEVQRVWTFSAGADVLRLREERWIDADPSQVSVETLFVRELARRAGWPVADLSGS